MQQTCHAQMAESSIDRRSRSSPQVVWERGCTPRATAGYQRQSRKLHGRLAMCGGIVCPQLKNASGAAKTPSVSNSIRALREKRVAEARVWASNLDSRAENVRKACLSFRSKTGCRSRSARVHRHRTPPRKCLGIFGRDHQTMFWPVGHTNSVIFGTFGLAGQEKWREQNYRHLAHNISPHHVIGISTHQSMRCQVCSAQR